MDKNDACYQAYLQILERELVPAMGCTEPIAIAYAAALAKKTLEEDIVKEVNVYASGNVIKNVKSVTVPNTGGRKGIETAVAIGIVGGDASKNLEVLADVTDEDIEKMVQFLKDVPIHVHRAQSDCTLDITIEIKGCNHTAKVKIVNEHENVVLIEKDQCCLLEKGFSAAQNYPDLYQTLNMRKIYDFAVSADIEDVKEILDRQINYNSTIAQEGLKNHYGASIASTLLSTYGNSVEIRARAMAAAGSDARMSGCDLPVIINSGSGNQGMTASLPVIEYWKEIKADKEKLYRALLISNLSTLYQKTYIGRLSAYCGVVSAGAGAGAGIAYLLDASFDDICHTIVNSLAITSGIICDGAKPSCAAKIAIAVDAGIMGYRMVQEGHCFGCGEGIVRGSIEKTIEGVGHLAREGMKETDDEIIKMMLEE